MTGIVPLLSQTSTVTLNAKLYRVAWIWFCQWAISDKLLIERLEYTLFCQRFTLDCVLTDFQESKKITHDQKARLCLLSLDFQGEKRKKKNEINCGIAEFLCSKRWVRGGTIFFFEHWNMSSFSAFKIYKVKSPALVHLPYLVYVLVSICFVVWEA